MSGYYTLKGAASALSEAEDCIWGKYIQGRVCKKQAHWYRC